MRIDDLDTPRNADGASSAILHCLERFGLHWDGEVYYQSQQTDIYAGILAQLDQQAMLYGCRCSRKKLSGTAIYPGFCRNADLPLNDATAWRLKARNLQIEFDDALQGKISQNLAEQHGDFIVRRKDHIVAYQLAVVVDDERQGINHIVRGIDLLDSTPKQIYIQQRLGYSKPHYLHLPLIVDEDGNKLSKQTLAEPVDDNHPPNTLFLCLQLLQQNPPPSLRQASINQQLVWAVAHWQPHSLCNIQTLSPRGYLSY